MTIIAHFYKLLSKKSLFLVFFLSAPILTFSQDNTLVEGKKLFNTNCAACHKLTKKAIGPPLANIGQKYDKEWLYKWTKNSNALIKSGDADAIKIWEEYNKVPMNAFPQFSNEDIDKILAYTDAPRTKPILSPNSTIENDSVKNQSTLPDSLILWLLITILVILILALNAINKKLKLLHEINKTLKEKPKKSLWKAFIENKFLLLLSAIFGLLFLAYVSFQYMGQIGIDQGYKPIQPIHFSHKIHAGDNKIECLYCHSSARVSKHSGVPSLNICMNCHKNISEYQGMEDLANGYTKSFYDNEIQKLYNAVGWNENTQTYTGKTKPVKWIRIHNLPDFVYFNHSQHVTVGKIACQKCHGPIEGMEIVEQHAPLTMSWCITCHRETNVNTKSNEYYEKIHAELAKKYNIKNLTVAEMGGLECGKCHY